MLPEKSECGVGVSGQFLQQAVDTACRGAVVCQAGKQGFFAFAIVLSHLYNVNHVEPLFSGCKAPFEDQ